jgi:SH3-like domain-containing protein
MKKSGCTQRFLWFGLVAGTIFIAGSCQRAKEQKLQSEVDQIAKHWVPDHRIGICNVKLTQGKNGAMVLSGETNKRGAKDELIKTLNNQCKVLIDSIILLPDTIKNEKYMGLVTLSVINLRKEPDHASELVSQARLGTPVLILKEVNSWLLIQTPDKYISWTEGSSVKVMTAKEISDWKKAPRVIYLENTGWLYDTTTATSGVVGDLTGGSILEKRGEVNGFACVVLPDGRRGFVDAKTIMDFDKWEKLFPSDEKNIERVAMRFMGLPYLWGGSSAKAVDCSGFVQSVYFMNGIILERDASLQALHGSAVDISDGYSRLKKGDLLFFGSKRNGVSRVTHVALYLGNNDYINSSGRVQINSLDPVQTNFSSKRVNSLLSARRILGVEKDDGIVPVFMHPWY